MMRRADFFSMAKENVMRDAGNVSAATRSRLTIIRHQIVTQNNAKTCSQFLLFPREVI
jgi:hypothetical protein